jgi:branched-chain amino acid transport system permease protein
MSVTLAGALIGTLVDGSLLALIGVGFVVIVRATRVVSFAQGAFMVVGALIFYSLTASAGLGLIPGLICSCAAMGIIGALTYRVAFARVVGAPALVSAMATIGLGILGEAVAIMVWGTQAIVIPASALHDNPLRIGGNFYISPAGIVSIVLAIAITAALIASLQFTKTGLRMRAVADHPRLAAFNGVNVVRMSTLAWAIAGVTAAAAGVAFTLGGQPSPDDVYSLGLIAFPAIILGGLDSIAGALVGGVLIAAVQQFTITYLGGQYEDLVCYGVLLIVLFVRPGGLFGRQEVARL